MEKYKIVDKVSGLPFHGITNSFINEMAKRKSKTLEEIVKEIQDQIKKEKIKYFVSRSNNELIVIAGEGRFKCQGEYFEEYKEALNFQKLE
jgi:hypothetical protein